MRVPFNKPSLAGRELEFVADAVRRGHISGAGHYTRRCEQVLAEIIGSPRILLTPSATQALEMTALLLEIEPGDEVIAPAFTFVSTINAFVMRGARPVFVDVRSDTMNLDERLLEERIGPRTKAIVVVHYAGVGCDMNAILEIAGRHGVAVVEDNAHGLFGRYRGRPLGSFGAFACQSFHETKNITCGEGGALAINDTRYASRAEIVREKGTDRSRFFRGEVDRYTWVDLGSSYLISDMMAAFLYGQLEAREAIQARRQALWERYERGLRDWVVSAGARQPIVPPDCEQPAHLYYVLMPSLERRQALIDELAKHEMQAVFHYLPLHLSRMGQRFGGQAGQYPVTEDVSDRLLRLPFYNDLALDDQDRVIEVIRSTS